MEEITSRVIDLANMKFGDNYRVSNDEIKPELCPLCHGGEHGDRYTFSINMQTGAWNCKRGNCTKGNPGGDFNRLASLLGVSPAAKTVNNVLKRLGRSRKKYSKPNKDDIKPLTEDIITYFTQRKISEKTLQDWKIGSDDNGNIVFPFYRNNELVFVKYRKPKKIEKGERKEWRMENTEPILFGMDNVSFNRPLIITEGQIDALSLYEAGCTNVVSVPSGCDDMTWIDNCWDWLSDFKWFILFGDSDDAGIGMISRIMDRLGQDRCMIPPEYPELIVGDKDYGRICKDANEILYAWGPEELASIVEGCTPDPVAGVLDIGKMPHVDIYNMPRIMTRIPKLDRMIGGLGEGGVTILSGKRGMGKSTICGPLMLNAIEQGYRCCMYSGELSAAKVRNDLYLQAVESPYIGYMTDPRSGKNIATISTEIEERINRWIEGNLFLFDNEYVKDGDSVDAVLGVFEACARRFGCKLFVVDNLMMLLSSADEETRAQAKTVTRFKNFATRFKAHILVVNKMARLCSNVQNKYGELTNVRCRISAAA